LVPSLRKMAISGPLRFELTQKNPQLLSSSFRSKTPMAQDEGVPVVKENKDRKLETYGSHTIHGTGIFTYMKTIEINH